MSMNPTHNLAPILFLLLLHLSSANHRPGHHWPRQSSHRPYRHSKNNPTFVNSKGRGPPSAGPAPPPNVDTNNIGRGPSISPAANNIPPNDNINYNGGGPPLTGSAIGILVNAIVDTNSNRAPHTTFPTNNIPPDNNVNDNGGGPPSIAPANNNSPSPNFNANNDMGPPTIDQANNIYHILNTNGNGEGPSANDIAPNPNTNPMADPPANVNTNNYGEGPSSIDPAAGPNANPNTNIGPPTSDSANKISTNVNTNNNIRDPSSIAPAPSPATTDPARNIPPNVNNEGGPSPTGPDNVVSFDPNIGSPTTDTSHNDDTSKHSHMAQAFIFHHNLVRAILGEHPFTWDEELARHARWWSNERRGDCALKHSGNKDYGENMFWGTGWDWQAADAVKFWAVEQFYYDWNNNACSPDKMCGHFTQMVWNTTMQVGCAKAECYNGQTIITCNYFPPGNYVGEKPY